MSDERGHPEDMPQSVEAIAALDAFLDDMTAERRPRRDPAPEEQDAYMMAAQLRLARDGVEEPSAAFLARLERDVATAAARQASPRKPGVSRGGFLRTLAGVAGGAGLGVVAVEGVNTLRDAGRPHDLVAEGNGRWYDVAAVEEVQDGGAKAFTAGGVYGYLLNDGGRLHAVSAICTHMGCRLKPTQPVDGRAGLQCLCHGSRFSRRGAVEHGLAPAALPEINVRVENGRVLALGTRETA